jgi:hypothetical protein
MIFYVYIRLEFNDLFKHDLYLFFKTKPKPYYRYISYRGLSTQPILVQDFILDLTKAIINTFLYPDRILGKSLLLYFTVILLFANKNDSLIMYVSNNSLAIIY